MNRIILIGNGFDLAHGMKTSYRDFIDDYWTDFASKVYDNIFIPIEDELVCFKKTSGPNSMYEAQNATSYGINNKNRYQYLDAFRKGIIPDFHKKLSKVDSYNTLKELILDTNEVSDFEFTLSFKNGFWEHISEKMHEGNWVDIENEYYEKLKKCTHDEVEVLNKELKIIDVLLEKYLTKIENAHIEEIENKYKEALANLEPNEDIRINSNENCIIIKDDKGEKLKLSPSNKNRDSLEELYTTLRELHKRLTDKNSFTEFKESIFTQIYSPFKLKDIHLSYVHPDNDLFFNKETQSSLPKEILFLNFNYTHTHNKYIFDKKLIQTIHIHGELNNDRNPIIFGYGDELSEDYKEIENKNDNEYLKNVKSIRYLETDNYRKMLSFIESESYQIFIMGHSCGNSDRTLLNTLFEHKNCVSIKPFYHIREDGTDNYNEIVQNISRNFTNKAAMRERVVNKTYCEPLT